MPFKVLKEFHKIIVASLLFLISFAWNDSLKQYFDDNFKDYGPFWYAISVSAIAFGIILVIKESKLDH